MKPPALLKQPELIVWFLINDTSKRFFAAVDKEMRSVGLTRAQWYLLTHAYYYDGLTQQELADTMDLTKSSAAKLIKKLEQKGWILRKTDNNDARVFRVYLIASIRPLIEALAQVARNALELPLSLLSKADMTQLTRLLRTIETTLDDPPARSADSLNQAKRNVESLLKQLKKSRIGLEL